MRRTRLATTLAALLTILLTAAVLPADAGATSGSAATTQRRGDDPYVLDILHVNDHHSHLAAEDIGLDIAGGEVEFELGGFPRVVEAMDGIEESLGSGANVARVHAGDAITGTLYYTLFGGEADAALMNEACFDVFALGNHEFDGGDAGLAEFLDDLNAGGCTDTIAANVQPRLGTPLWPRWWNSYIQPVSVKDYGGEKVGFVGIDIAQKTKVSSSPLDSTHFADEVRTAQLWVWILTLFGIDKIVLVTHQGYGNDLDLASQVWGVDAIVGGDSHSLLGDFAGYGLSPEGEYPTETRDRWGNKVCVAQAWQYSWMVGHLQVSFDQRGRVTDCGGTANLMLGPVADSGGVAEADIQAAIAADPQLAQWGTDAESDAILAGYSEQVDVLAQQVVGTAAEDICQGRFPNDGRSVLCPVGTLDQGGEIQQLVTQAFLERAFRADIALQNSGGVRIDIPAGEVSIADAYELLPFANTLYELDMTGAEIALALEQGIGNVLDNGGSTGAFPYGAGIRWDLDLTAPSGSRFSNIEVRRKGATDWEPLDPNASYVVAANSFMATGGDGYAVLADVVADGRGVDTFLDYAQSFIDWIVEDRGGSISKPAEYSLKSFVE